MRFMVMSRNCAKAYCYKPNDEASIIISIHTPGDEPNKLFVSEKNGVKAIFPVCFADVDGENSDCMCYSDGLNIARFIQRHLDAVDTIIVHCDAGISRSAGVCAAIMKGLTDDDSQIFDNSYYAPNMHCYRMTLEAMYQTFED